MAYPDPVCPTCQASYGGSAHCRACHLTFTSDSSFDDHRTGPYHPDGLRRCLTVEEMVAPWRLTDRGWTTTPPMTDEQRARAKARAQKASSEALEAPQGDEQPLPGVTTPTP